MSGSLWWRTGNCFRERAWISTASTNGKEIFGQWEKENIWQDWTEMRTAVESSGSYLRWKGKKRERRVCSRSRNWDKQKPLAALCSWRLFSFQGRG